jgi:tRNA pseudouridine38-40 synthase
MPRLKLTVAYEGTLFHGWQRQEPPPPEVPLRTVQGVLEQAVREAVREPVTVIGASRTDAGVHARGQCAAFTCADLRIPLDRLPRAINARLPDDVQVRKAELAIDGFDPIRDCIAKGYRYRVVHGGRRRALPPLFRRRLTTYTFHRLDPELMNEGARRLLGEHDFASFAQINHGRETTVRTIFQCKVEATSPSRCQLDIAGSGFLYNMVRIIAGTLVEIGRGKIPPERIPDILAARDRTAAGPTLPPEGLCLMWTKYPESVLMQPLTSRHTS